MKDVWNWIRKRRQIIEVILILFVPQVCLVVANKSWQAMLMFLICSLVVCVLFFQDRINKLKVGKGVLEIDLQEAIKEAYATIDNIKDLTDPVLNFNLQEMAAEDLAFEGTSYDERITFFDKARMLARKLELNSSELDNSFIKAKIAILYSFNLEIERAFDKVTDHQGRKVTSKFIEQYHSSGIDMVAFKNEIESLPINKRKNVQYLYDALEKFLKETSDIGDNFH